MTQATAPFRALILVSCCFLGEVELAVRMIPGRGCGTTEPIEIIHKLPGSQQPSQCTGVQDAKSFQESYAKKDLRYSKWSPCSKDCGLGEKYRLIECFVGGKLATPEECDQFVTLNITAPCTKRPCVCPSDYTDNFSKCFKFFALAKTWSDAESHCQAEGGHLPSVHSNEQSSFLSDLDPSLFWLGFSRSPGGAWHWTNGAPNNYTDWHPGQPDAGSQHCTVHNYRDSGQWDNSGCYTERNVVCEIHPR